MSYYLLCGLALVLVTLFRLRNVGRRAKGLPPGPPVLPLIGNLHLMPKKDPQHQFKKWAEEYGQAHLYSVKFVFRVADETPTQDQCSP